MNHIKNIWKNTFLGKLFDSDPLMAKGISLVLLAYLCVHIFRLEVYPMYLYAMFSKKETPKKYYHTYHFYNGSDEIDLTDWDYRKYTVLMNTVQQYDGILQNNMVHPEAKVIDKFVNKLYLSQTGIGDNLKKQFDYNNILIGKRMNIWFAGEFEIPTNQLSIYKKAYDWTANQPILKDIELLTLHAGE